MREQKRKKNRRTHRKTLEHALPMFIVYLFCFLSSIERVSDFFLSITRCFFLFFFFSFTDLILQFWYFTLHCIQFLPSINSVCSYRHTFICIFMSLCDVSYFISSLFRLFFWLYFFLFGHAYTHFTIAYLYKWHSNAYFRHVRCRQNDS